MNLAPGQQLSHYRLVEKIGEGGMGVVWKAVDERLEREVAIKLLPDDVAGDAEHLSRFRREAKVLAGLNHANIATIHDLDEAGGVRFLVMEHVAGEDLARRLSRGPLPLAEVSRLGRQIAAALEAAHARGVIHRDLKPGNILITADGTAKLLDFGLAKAFQAGGGDVTEAPTVTGSRTRDGVILGTVPYMSPEQARGRELDARTDLWSLGCILFEALSGRRAFPGETVSDTLAAILKEAPDWKALPSAAPAALREVIRSCLAKDPAARPASAAAVRASLERPGEAAAGRRSDLVWVGAVIVALIALLVFYPRRSDEGGGAAPELRQLTVEAGIEEFPAWSPDGGSLAYSAGVEGVRKLFLLDLESGAARQLTDGDHDDIQPAWSPDGTTLLFVRGRREGVRMEPGDEFGVYDGGDVWSLDVLGDEALPLVENAAGPSWSPEGERIALDAS
ncbi:MAG: protein kinase, partial [Acidobacteriota bacterium]